VSQPANAPPLAGVRVVDLSRVLAGPYATMTLADLGADVVKIEQPAGGDETRTWGPPFAGGESAYFLSVNRGKRSVALNLKDPEGRELALELCARADVVIENFRPGGAARLGLDYEAVRKRRPDVVYCTISGFGAREPHDRAGYDFTVQAESGLMAITGDPDGEPMKVGVAIVDVLAGLNAATASLAALRRRDLTGAGDRVEVSLLDTAFAALVNVGANALLTGEEPQRYGNAHPSIVPYQPFRAADGWIAVAAANDGLYAKLCEAIERPDLADDERYATNEARVSNREPLIAELQAVFAARSTDDWERLLLAAGVPAGKIRSVGEALRTAPARTRCVQHPTAGLIELVGPPFELDSAALGPSAAAPPALGQHTDEVLRELGVDDKRLASLEERGVIARSAA
jgi:crotonobetainyl-CoA:carnitine CoA-transferase CaiB-like acyl-CoA transferase